MDSEYTLHNSKAERMTVVHVWRPTANKI